MAKHYKNGKEKSPRGLKLALILLAAALVVFIAALNNQGRFAQEQPQPREDVIAVIPAPEPEPEPEEKLREVVTVSADEGLPQPEKKTDAAQSGGDKALLAIVIDDGGSQMNLTKRVAALDLPATWAIMPYRQYSKETAELAASKDVPYIVHLPMQAQSDKDSERGKFIIGRGMSAKEVRAKTAKALDSLPGAIGLNNHRGSRATELPELMAPLMQELKSRDLIFFDSRTSGKSVAYGEALKADVPALKNRGFLDNSSDKKEIAKRFDELMRNAQKRGDLVVICHFRPSTVAFLEELAPRANNLPVRLVTLPEMLAHTGAPIYK